MFGVGGFGFEIRIIIPILDIQEHLTDFHRNEAGKKFVKKVQNGRLKKTEFLKIANSQKKYVNFKDWVLD